ncbi:hypothetical protein H0H87_007396 [Tephrocybe sp. NHM501043]|nr:hypothetical protein H0H87_007396 [Tephrocybe sp. NHM501043]
MAPPTAAPSKSKLITLFNKYKDPDAEEITVDGTIKLCEDLDVNPEDVVLLAVAFELKSPRVGEWTKGGWIDGWKALGFLVVSVDTISGMKALLPRLSTKLSDNPDYFRQVYKHTFDFARTEGQRSLGIDTAQAFWALLLPHGLQGAALSHQKAESGDGDVSMEEEEGWKPEYTNWWFEFLNEKGGKGVSKDTWVMVRFPSFYISGSDMKSVFGLLAHNRLEVHKLQHGRSVTIFSGYFMGSSKFVFRSMAINDR